jgi:hypothetical protein
MLCLGNHKYPYNKLQSTQFKNFLQKYVNQNKDYKTRLNPD